MIDATPQRILEEIKKSETLRNKVTEASKDMVAAYAGRYHVHKQQENPLPENHFFQWINNVKPTVIHDNPRVQVKSSRSGVTREASAAMQAGLNAWIKTINLKDTLASVFDDAAFSFGVVLTRYEPVGAAADGELQPYIARAKRVAPHRWFCDHACDRYDPEQGDSRYAGHMWRRDKDDLLADKDFNREAVDAILVDAGMDKWNATSASEKPGRDEIIGYEVWFPELRTSDDPHAHGTIFTLGTALTSEGQEVEAQWIRDPRPYFGPASGPYTLFGYHFVPNCPYPLSPFAAVYDQVKDLNAHAVAVARDAAAGKRLIAVDAASGGNAEIIEEARHGDVVKIDGLSQGKGAINLEVGGVDAKALDYLNRLQDRNERATGLDENGSGDIDANASATAIADAAGQRDIRRAMLKRAFDSATTNILKTGGWYIFTQEGAVFPLDPDTAAEFRPRPDYLPPEDQAEQVADELGMDPGLVREAVQHNPRVVFGGGPSDDVMTEITGDDGGLTLVVSPNAGGLQFEDMEFDIEPYSMERTNEAMLQRRAMQAVDMLTNAADKIVQHPEILWVDLFDYAGSTINMPDMGTRFIDLTKLPQPTGPAQAEAPGVPQVPSGGMPEQSAELGQAARI